MDQSKVNYLCESGDDFCIFEADKDSLHLPIQQSMKILIIQTAFIGDVILTTPVVESLKKQYPESTLDFLLRKGNESLFSGHPLIRKIRVFDKKHNKLHNLHRLIHEIRKEKYDLLINLQRFFTTGLITVLSGARKTYGFDKNPLSFLFTVSVKHGLSLTGPYTMHEVDRNLSLISILVKEPQRRPVLYPHPSDYHVVPSGEDYVCIAPASVWFTKQLPGEKWIELISRLPGRIRVYLVGSAGDAALCESIREACLEHQVKVLAGKLTFLESAALISKARMTFANDSAPLHLASAMNAPVAAVFCSTVPAFGFGPLSDLSLIIETEQELACRPCGLHGKKDCPEGHFRCAEIDVDKVLKRIGIA
jgi:heptosyltransferase-2